MTLFSHSLFVSGRIKKSSKNLWKNLKYVLLLFLENDYNYISFLSSILQLRFYSFQNF